MTNIWLFTCPLCKKKSDCGSPVRVDKIMRWICCDCRKKLIEKERENIIERGRIIDG